MSHYNLEKLGWFNFESLIRCLSREIIGSGLSAFSGSRDQGRDATFNGKASRFPSNNEQWEGNWIIQVKHREYSSRGAQYVRNELKKTIPDEIDKILNKHNFQCNNYLFFTNCPFTSSDKDEVDKIVKKFQQINNFSILAEKDIEELLDVNPRVVSAFPQILGLGQLRELTNWGLHQRSYQYLEFAQAEISKFVATGPYLESLDLLHKHHFCVLTGPPKMGKTCTAYALSAAFSALGFEIYELRNQREFYDAFTPKSKQLFICDDVFGDIAIDTSLRDDWTKSFLRLLRSLGTNHKLVWTAREYILKEAFASSRLKEEYPDIITEDTITVAVDSLSRLEKAMILYNHAKDGNLASDVIDFLKSDACVKIVDHECFSPESIRQLCTGRLVDFSKQAAGNQEILLREVEAYLSEPGEAWKAAYLAAHPCEQLLCSEVMAAGGNINLDQLKHRYEGAITSMRGHNPPFDIAISNTIGTFLQLRHSFLGYQNVQFYHPSMRDLMIEVFQADKIHKRNYLKQLQLKELPSIIKTKGKGQKDDSSHHRIEIDTNDLDLIKDHITHNLLPNALLTDVISVLTEIMAILDEDKIRAEKRKLRDSDNFPEILWITLDLVLTHACDDSFWLNNIHEEYVPSWRRLLDKMRLLLPMHLSPIIPSFLSGLIRRLEDKKNVELWGLAVAAHSIAPTVVEQCLNFEDRLECRKALVDRVREALDDAESSDIEADYDDSNYWHDQYETLIDECRDYEYIFPEDEPIENLEDVEGILENFPRIGEEPDYDDIPPSSSTTSASEDIKTIFADL